MEWVSEILVANRKMSGLEITQWKANKDWLKLLSKFMSESLSRKKLGRGLCPGPCEHGQAPEETAKLRWRIFTCSEDKPEPDWETKVNPIFISDWTKAVNDIVTCMVCSILNGVEVEMCWFVSFFGSSSTDFHSDTCAACYGFGSAVFTQDHTWSAVIIIYFSLFWMFLIVVWTWKLTHSMGFHHLSVLPVENVKVKFLLFY